MLISNEYNTTSYWHRYNHDSVYSTMSPVVFSIETESGRSAVPLRARIVIMQRSVRMVQYVTLMPGIQLYNLMCLRNVKIHCIYSLIHHTCKTPPTDSSGRPTGASGAADAFDINIASTSYRCRCDVYIECVGGAGCVGGPSWCAGGRGFTGVSMFFGFGGEGAKYNP